MILYLENLEIKKESLLNVLNFLRHYSDYLEIN
jgi:hypothetical protein